MMICVKRISVIVTIDLMYLGSGTNGFIAFACVDHLRLLSTLIKLWDFVLSCVFLKIICY